MPSPLDQSAIAEPEESESTGSGVLLVAPFDRAHIAAEFREDRPLWRRLLSATAATLKALFAYEWSDWDAEPRSDAFCPRRLGDTEMPLLRSTDSLCCSDRPATLRRD